MIIALVGNQNCGKTTLFNALTGSNQHVGNFPGVTVDSKSGFVKEKKDLEIIDLPGIYSLSPYSNEEIVTRDFIIKNKPDVILNIIDATNIERNLYLTLQLIELDIPVVLALNMMDEVEKAGNSIDIHKLENQLGIRVCSISAQKKEGINDLIDTLLVVAKQKELPKVKDICKEDSPVHRAIHAMMMLIDDHSKALGIPLRYASTRLIEGDEILLNSMELSDNEKDIVGHVVQEMETDSQMDREVAIAKMRYEFIDTVSIASVLRQTEETQEKVRTKKMDAILTNKYLAFPIFLLIMALVFYLTFGLIGYWLSQGLEILIDMAITNVRSGMESYGMNPVVTSLVTDGIMTGVGSVISFLPTVVILFMFLSLLEDSGYMARIAFIMDRPLRKLGLSGRSFVPMLIGFGCSVPAVMASRTLTSSRDKRLTIFLIPYMSCSAKLPIYTVLTAAFFGARSPIFMIALYLLSIVIGIIVALIIKLFVKGKPTPFMMELPVYRIPGAQSTFRLILDKAKDFVKKAFTVIFAATIIVWFFQSFDLKLNYVEDNSLSILASASALIAPIFSPMGLGKWEIAASLITGLSAKEAVVSTLSVLVGGASNLRLLMTPLSAFSMLVFVALYMPCVATFSVVRKELSSTKMAVFYMMMQTVIAYIVSLMVYGIGRLF